MKNRYYNSELNVGVESLENGAKIADIIAELEVGYGKFWAHWSAVRMEAGETTPLAATGSAIAAARHAKDEFSSWGWLAVRANVAEGKARKLFSEATNVDHMGLRIGKGGRYVEGNPVYYAKELAATGVERSLDEARMDALARTLEERVAASADYSGLSYGDLRTMAKDRGYDWANGKSKQDLITFLRSA